MFDYAHPLNGQGVMSSKTNATFRKFARQTPKSSQSYDELPLTYVACAVLIFTHEISWVIVLAIIILVR